MYGILKHLRVIEGASFVAAPSCALYLQQLGAQVIRFDDMRSAPDRNRWPKSAGGASLYWEGLNKGKQSVALDLSRPEGREIAIELITAPGDNAGLFVTNYPATGFLSFDNLATKRHDLIALRLMGWPSGRQAVDYTVNSAIGVPFMTGPESMGDQPVNHALPAWDLLAGAYAAFCLLAAQDNRRSTGRGGEIRLPLADVAATALGNLGQIAEVIETQQERPRTGNDIFGAFGRDFETSDGKRLMVVAISARQWRGLVTALNVGAEVQAYEQLKGVDFSRDEGVRFMHRAFLNALVGGAIAQRSHDDLARAFNANGVCWDGYNTLGEFLRDNIGKRTDGLFADIQHPSGLTYPTPGSASHWVGRERRPPEPAPILGAHTEQVLVEVLGYSSAKLARLIDQGVVHCPS